MAYLLFFLSIFAMCILLCMFIAFVDWTTHKDMVRDNTETYGYAGYKEFVREFHKVEWSYREQWGDSLFSQDTFSHEGYYHASIIKFNDRGMIIKNPIEYLRVRKYVKKYIKENFGKTLVNWMEE